MYSLGSLTMVTASTFEAKKVDFSNCEHLKSMSRHGKGIELSMLKV